MKLHAYLSLSRHGIYHSVGPYQTRHQNPGQIKHLAQNPSGVIGYKMP